MIQSMTGYGKATGLLNNRKLTVEIRSLNGKSTDLRIKYPSKYGSKEMDIRKFVLNKLDRGRFDMTITIDGDVTDDYVLDEELFKAYYRQMKNLSDELQSKQADFFPTIVRIPNVIHTNLEDLSDDEWNTCQKLLEEAVNKTVEYRKSEGEAMKTDIATHLRSIMLNLIQVSTHEPERIQTIKNKISNNLNGLAEDQKIDQNRFEQELIYYLERLDINEEKIRLEQNCNYFKQLLDDPTKVTKGKKLTFISQEIGREINTMGAKAQYAPIQQLVINMKDDLERIKEQLLNVL